MDPILIDRVRALRAALAKTRGAGYIAPGFDRSHLPQEVPAAYREFLRVADGAACGDVQLFESTDILKKQSDVKLLRGGRSRWFCFGQIREQSLVMDVVEGTAHLMDEDDLRDAGESLGELDYFLLTSVFGDGYEEFSSSPHDDAWLDLVRRVSQADVHG